MHQEALNSLDHAFAAAKPLTLLLGEAGTGKTTIIRAAIQKQSQHTHCVHLQNPGLTRDEFVQMVARQFGLSARARMSKTDLLLEFEQLLRERHDLAQHTVLVVDEAQNLPEELLEELRLLTNIETNNEKPLSLVLAGQPELGALMNEPAWRHLKQRVALRCELRPLDVRETALYIASRISAFGGVPVQTFTKEAVVLIHQYSRGIPRTINVIADNALLGAFGADQRPVTTRIVHAVCADFDIRESRRIQPTSRINWRSLMPRRLSRRKSRDSSMRPFPCRSAPRTKERSPPPQRAGQRHESETSRAAL